MNINLSHSPLVRTLAQFELPDTGRPEAHDLRSLGRRLFLNANTVRRMLASGELKPDGVREDGVLFFDSSTLAAGRRAVLQEIVSAVLTARPNASESELASLVAQAIARQRQQSERDTQGAPDRADSENDDIETKERNATRLGKQRQRY